MIIQLIKSIALMPFVPALDPNSVFKTYTRQYRVWPHLADLNFHLNNANYLKLMEHARWNWFARKGWFRLFLKTKINLVVAGVEISFFRELPVMRKFSLTTQVLTWDAKYFYIEHRLMIGDSLCCQALIKVAVIRQGKLLPIKDFCRALNIDYEKAHDFPLIDEWKNLSKIKYKHTKSQ